MKFLARILSALALASLLVASPGFTADKPLVIESGKIKQLPSSTTLQINASGTGAASINIPHGTAPTSPTNGDCWTQTTGLFCQINGSTVGPYGTGTGSAITAKDEGSTLTTGVTSVDFAGAGVTATNSGGAVTITIPGVAGSGGQVLINEVVTSGSQANVTFSSIAATYRDLLVVVRGRGTASATAVNVLLQFNGDTGANYDYEDWHAVSTTAAGAQTVGATSAFIGLLMGATATANRASVSRAYISDYRGTTFDKPILSSGTDNTGTATFTQGSYVPTATWRPSTPVAITSVKVFLSSGNFVDNSVVSLYGLP